MEKKLSSKYIHMYMSISRVFIRLTGNVLKLFPFAMVICPVVWFYLCPEHIISDIVNDWQDADTLEKILLVKLYLKTVLIRKRLVRTVLIFTESSDQLSRATDRVP
ncbi:hypothetical protein PO520_20165, partial [Escherichia coli]